LIEADPGQLDQVLINLAVNARDAMPRGGKFILETGIVQLDEAFTRDHAPIPAGEYIVLAVSDTGTGMDAQTLSRIFDPFFTTKAVGKGTGLGLSTVYGIVRQSGGHIWVYSEPGRGTTFKIYLPSAEHKIREIPQPAAEEPPPKPKGATVLLVEDDEMMRQLTRKVIEDHGYHVLEASDGVSALQAVADHQDRIDLLLTDVVMRGMGGPELVTKMRTSHPSLKVVFMSGYTGELIANHSKLSAGITLLEKPFSRTALLKTLHTALGERNDDVG